MTVQAWVWLAIASAVFFGLGDYLVVYSEQRKMNVITLYVTYTILIGLANLVYLLWFRKNGVRDVVSFTKEQWLIVVGLCVLYFFAYMMHFVSIQRATNPGYANALVMFHVVVLTMLSYWFLGKPLNAKAVGGIALIFIGGWLVTMNS